MRDRQSALGEEQEKAFLLGLILQRETRAQCQRSLDELVRLVTTSGALIIGEAIYRQDRMDAHTGLTKGHVSDLVERVSSSGASLLVSDFDLRPAQTKTLEQVLGITVLDRTQVILDIFAIHARTEEARCQVELAQLEYELPRLPHLWTHLSRMEGGIGMRGPGEKQIETDRQIMKQRISHLRRKLAIVAMRKSVSRHSREEAFKVSLVGYTNAGKSSILNALTGSDVLVKDQLFSTLDATSRAIKLPLAGRVVLTDTVGFIRRLPHHLITSFEATLAETVNADLLIHVVDASSESWRAEWEAVVEVLDGLGCGDKPRRVALNKMDLAPDASMATLEEGLLTVPVSCVTGQGLSQLRDVIQEEGVKRRIPYAVRISMGRPDLLARLRLLGGIGETQEDGEQLHLKMFLSPQAAHKILNLQGVQANPM